MTSIIKKQCCQLDQKAFIVSEDGKTITFYCTFHLGEAALCKLFLNTTIIQQINEYSKYENDKLLELNSKAEMNKTQTEKLLNEGPKLSHKENTKNEKELLHDLKNTFTDSIKIIDEMNKLYYFSNENRAENLNKLIIEKVDLLERLRLNIPNNSNLSIDDLKKSTFLSEFYAVNDEVEKLLEKSANRKEIENTQSLVTNKLDGALKLAQNSNGIMKNIHSILSKYNDSKSNEEEKSNFDQIISKSRSRSRSPPKQKKSKDKETDEDTNDSKFEMTSFDKNNISNKSPKRNSIHKVPLIKVEGNSNDSSNILNSPLSNNKAFKYIVNLNHAQKNEFSVISMQIYNTFENKYFMIENLDKKLKTITKKDVYDVRCVSTGEGIFITGGYYSKHEMSRECFVGHIIQKGQNVDVFIQKYEPMKFTRKRHNLVLVDILLEDSKYYQVVFCLSGLKTKECEYTILNRNDKSWYLLPSLRETRANASTVVCNNKLYIFGGHDSEKEKLKQECPYSNSIEFIDLKEFSAKVGSNSNRFDNSWGFLALKEPSFIQKSAMSTLSFGSDSKFLLFGGFTDTNTTNNNIYEVETGDGSSDQWTFSFKKSFESPMYFLNQNFKQGVKNIFYAYQMDKYTLMSYDLSTNCLSKVFK